jgi:hypothetical protein
VFVGLTAKNNGNATWYNSGPYPVDLATVAGVDRMSSFCDATWMGCNRPARLKEASVAPGATGTFEFWYDPPAVSGTFHEHFDAVAESIGFMNDLGLNFYSVVGNYAWSLVSQSVYSDAGYTNEVGLNNLSPGAVTYWKVTAENTGTATWYNTGAYPLDLGTTHAQDRSSAFCDNASWTSCDRPARLMEASVAPGATGTFEFKTVAPAAGHYLEYFNPVAEGAYWLNDPGMNFSASVH